MPYWQKQNQKVTKNDSFSKILLQNKKIPQPFSKIFLKKVKEWYYIWQMYISFTKVFFSPCFTRTFDVWCFIRRVEFFTKKVFMFTNFYDFSTVWAFEILSNHELFIKSWMNCVKKEFLTSFNFFHISTFDELLKLAIWYLAKLSIWYLAKLLWD